MVIRMVGAAAIATVMSLSSTNILAEEGHGLGSIRGEQGIELKAFDHAMAGSIRDFVIWGSLNEETGTSELIMRRDGQDVKATFKKTNNVFGGIVEHLSPEGKRQTKIAFTKLDRQKNEYSFEVNGTVVKGLVTSEDFANNHFIKPTYVLQLADGKSVTFKFDGQACYNYSLHILTMMIASIVH